ncbi:hypothetical protein AVEN_103486-1 [Araneus ventricosus]|uniref:Uncharacterized protein n=1 Tax=Araneus ventricosus TaxID=182803 RepID=A0A4Y2F188_ARAVE|nr:hypothetical protein AVEN_140745-1 [Araneus ventricosus]GBO44446.1 hypothetical protein AVEN_103486-1 [Araneus ventricosus]
MKYRRKPTVEIRTEREMASQNLRSPIYSGGDIGDRRQQSPALSDRMGRGRIHLSVVDNFHQLELSHQSFDSADTKGDAIHSRDGETLLNHTPDLVETVKFEGLEM